MNVPYITKSENGWLTVEGIGDFSVFRTFDCGQCFRFDPVFDPSHKTEVEGIAFGKYVRFAEDGDGKLYIKSSEEDFNNIWFSYLGFDCNYDMINEKILTSLSGKDALHMKRAYEASRGIRILRQDSWEALCSFIISQNNNIPRIRKIIKSICAEYGHNLAEGKLQDCPAKKGCTPGCEECKGCGICYSFPTPEQVLNNPEGLLPSHPGFRYKYLLDAARQVSEGNVDLDKIKAEARYEYTLEELKKIKGVGDKVASCVALFGFGNLEAFPIDVWMKRAIDEYFDGNLDPTTLGQYAGIAQQYIFHYIRNLNG